MERLFNSESWTGLFVFLFSSLWYIIHHHKGEVGAMLRGFYVVRMEEIFDLRQDEKPASCGRHVLQIPACFDDKLCQWWGEIELSDWDFVHINRQTTASWVWLQNRTQSGCNSDPGRHQLLHSHSFSLQVPLIDTLQQFFFSCSQLLRAHYDLLSQSEKFSRRNASRAADSQRCPLHSALRGENRLDHRERRKWGCRPGGIISMREKVKRRSCVLLIILSFFNFLCVHCSNCWYHTYFKHTVHAFYSS